jgi:hypothetical protein
MNLGKKLLKLLILALRAKEISGISARSAKRIN